MPGSTRACAFLTMEDESAFVTDYRPAIAPLNALGWSVDCVPWRTPGVDWSGWDAVYIAAPWDYTDSPAAFMAVLETIDRSGAALVNPLALVRWNLDKRYLKDLEQRGIAIVPSAWYERYDAAGLHAAFERFATHALVIKPQVGANAESTFVLSQPVPPELDETLARVYARRPHIVQPFMEAIRTDGEYSLFYLGGILSHAIRKLPKPGDFRVQEEHGADIRPATAGAGLARAGAAALAAVRPAPVYARADFVRDQDGRFLLMELELIEPSLYLRMDDAAPARFAQAFDDYVRAG